MSGDRPGWDDVSKRIRDAVWNDATTEETLLDSLAGIDGWVDAVGRVAFPLIEAAVREHIAAEIEARRDDYAGDEHSSGYASGMDDASRIARGES